jgi:hypothetical protein
MKEVLLIEECHQPESFLFRTILSVGWNSFGLNGRPLFRWNMSQLVELFFMNQIYGWPPYHSAAPQISLTIIFLGSASITFERKKIVLKKCCLCKFLIFLRQFRKSILFNNVQFTECCTLPIGSCRPLDDITNPYYKLLCFLTTIFFKEKKA